MRWLSAFLLLTLLQACSSKSTIRRFLSAEDEAVLELLKDIRKNPNDRSLLNLLPETYYRAMDARAAMKGYVMRDNPPGDRWVLWRRQLEASQSITDAVLAMPIASSQISRPVHFRDQISEARQLAAEEYYNTGLELLRYNNRIYAERALTAFRKANEEVPGYRDVQQRILEAEEMAMIVVLVNPVDYYQYGWNHWGLQNDWLQWQMLRDLNARSFRNVRFFDERELRSRNLRPDRIVDMRFLRLFVGSPFTERRTVQRSKQITETPPPSRPGQSGTTTQPQPATTTVYATVNITRRFMTGDADLECRIYDVPTGRNILFDRYPGRYNWVMETATYTGDRRALTDEDWRMINNRFQRFPTREDVAQQLIQDAYGQLTARIQQGVRFDTW